jgi:glutamate-5-semialdehyde dehydrogenase
VPVSLHGTGGAWMVAGTAAGPDAFRAAVVASLDRKVCNTLNVCCIPRERASDLVPVFLGALEEAGRRRGTRPLLHVLRGSEQHVGEVEHHLVEETDLATEWEWEDRPEVTLAVTDQVEHAVELCNRWSPRFVASLVSDDADEQQRFWAEVDAPFVGNGFTRWVDGQYALRRPELGLSNWQHGRLFARGGVLSGDGVHTIRLRATQSDPTVHR